MERELKHISKFMSLVLRHRPEVIGLMLDANGWANVDELVEKLNANENGSITKEMIETVVATNEKKRFAFNADNTMIRASQGHSIPVELELPQVVPLDILYHGTAEQHVMSILQSGLHKQGRQHVHLSADTVTAKAVGSRHGKPAVLTIDAEAMHASGFAFYLSANNVWLVDTVPANFIKQ